MLFSAFVTAVENSRATPAPNERVTNVYKGNCETISIFHKKIYIIIILHTKAINSVADFVFCFLHKDPILCFTLCKKIGKKKFLSVVDL